ncbi:MAG: DNA-directed RNA polymerase [Candidatus Rokuibacteriota bacterium]
METNPKPYLPMLLTGARRIEGERLAYREAQRLHHAAFPDYPRGWRRPSDTTAARVIELTGVNPADLTVTEHQALVVVLDAAIQAGEDGRLLGHNIIFDALAAAWSDWYRFAVERGPARVSWEMDEATLKGAWRDLGRNEIDMAKMLRHAQHGYGLYEATKGRDGRYTVELTGATEERRQQFLDILKEDAAHGGTYRRRSSWPRLRLADGSDTPSTIENATTRKVVAEFAYNVAVPGERSIAVIRHLEGTHLYVTAGRIEAEYDWLMDQAQQVFVQAHALGVDVTKSPTKVRIKVKDQGTGQKRDGATSAWRRHLGEVLAKTQEAERAKLKTRAIALAKQYDKYAGQARQLYGPMMQLLALVRAGKLGRDEEIAIRARYAKLSNRRFQARDFWFSEISGKAATEIAELLDGGYVEDEDGNEYEASVDLVTTRRGRLFRVAASTSAEERERRARENERNYPFESYDPKLLDSRQDLVGVDVSGSQIQIYAVLLGLRKLEDLLRTNRSAAVWAWRAWTKHKDPRDPFELPRDYTGPRDERLQAAAKAGVMTWLYDSKPPVIAERLDNEGHGLGTAANLKMLLEDDELGLDVIARKWKPAVRRLAAQAYKQSRYTGIVFEDPFDGATVRWNPVKWSVPQDRRMAGTDDVRISAKVPADTTRNAAGELPVWKQKLASMAGPSFIHMLDSMFCGFVVEELAARGVRDVVAVHDAWYVAADAEGKLRDAIRAASVLWFKNLGGVYDELERLLGPCVPYKRGPKKGQCRQPCRCWIGELRATWKARMDAGDYPIFNVGEASPAREVYR